MDLALGLDLGTTSLAAVAVDGDGRVVRRARAANDAAVGDLPPGRAEQDPARLRELAVRVLAELARDLPGPPTSLGLTGQMHGVVLLDGSRRPLTPLITWQDRRANETGPDGRSQLDAYLERCSDADLEATGCRLSPGYLAVTLFALARAGEPPREARTAAFLIDWIGAELRDGSVATDRTNAGSAGVYDLRRDRWSEALIRAGDLDPALFPPVEPSGAVLGGLSESAAAETGLPAGLPVGNAIGDNQAAFLGSVGEAAAGDVLQVNLGTGGQISWPIEKFQRAPGMETRALPPDRFLLVGAGLAGGDAYAWVARTAQAWLRAFGAERPLEAVFERLGELADLAPENAGGLRAEPTFRGTRQAPLARGRFKGVTDDNFTPGGVARAVAAGIVTGLHEFYAQAGDARPQTPRRLVASGNAPRRNPLLVAELERRFGLPVELPADAEEAAVGAALLTRSAG